MYALGFRRAGEEVDIGDGLRHQATFPIDQLDDVASSILTPVFGDITEWQMENAVLRSTGRGGEMRCSCRGGIKCRSRRSMRMSSSLPS